MLTFSGKCGKILINVSSLTHVKKYQVSQPVLENFSSLIFNWRIFRVNAEMFLLPDNQLPTFLGFAQWIIYFYLLITNCWLFWSSDENFFVFLLPIINCQLFRANAEMFFRFSSLFTTCEFFSNLNTLFWKYFFSLPLVAEFSSRRQPYFWKISIFTA